MNQTTIFALIGVFVLIVAGMFGYAYWFQATDTTDSIVEEEGEVLGEDEERFAYIERVTAKHFYIDGVHTFAGEIDMPTPCDLLEAEIEVRESMPEQLHISFSVINEADFCAQVITPQRFMVSAPASEEAAVTADFMGRTIELNLLEPEPGETPDDFELFIKG